MCYLERGMYLGAALTSLETEIPQIFNATCIWKFYAIVFAKSDLKLAWTLIPRKTPQKCTSKPSPLSPD